MIWVVNRFAGTRLEDLQGEIPTLCKDQHGCRYLQKKLEEGVPEHRDMIFRETFGHFADLMTGKSACPERESTLLINEDRSVRQLFVPETVGVLHRRATQRNLRVRRTGPRQHLAQYARYARSTKND